MTAPHYIIKRPLILTEKGNRLREATNQYLFEVALDANKHQIRQAIQSHFPNVRVEAVRTSIVRGRLRRMGRGHARTKNWKKAVVTLREGDKIDVFDSF